MCNKLYIFITRIKIVGIFPVNTTIKFNNIPFGAAVKLDGSIDWENAYDFDPCDEDVEFVAHMCDKVMQAKALHDEHFSGVFVK